MKIQFTTTFGDLWLGTLYRISKNIGIIGLIVVGAAFLTWSNPYWSFSHGEPPHDTLVKIAYLFFVHLASLCAAGFVGLSVMVPFIFGRSKGIVGRHELEAQEAGLFELTDVNQSLLSYCIVGDAKRVFGLWILPVGPGFFAFRKNRVTAGDLDSFIRILAERKED